MLQLFILREVMLTIGSGGVGEGIRLAHLWEAHSIPKTTFYRALNDLILGDEIVRLARNRYVIGSSFLRACRTVVKHYD